MANVYGLVTDYKKYGTGSLYVPHDTTGTKRFVIQPVTAGALDIGSSEDFYFSAWVQYTGAGPVVNTLPAYYPIIKYGDLAAGGWELGYLITSSHTSVYFRDNTSGQVEAYSSGMAHTERAVPGSMLGYGLQFDHWVVKRTNNVLSFEFDNGFRFVGTTGIPNNFGSPIVTTVSNKTNSYNTGTSGVILASTTTGAGNVNSDYWIDEVYLARGISAPAGTDPATGKILNGGSSSNAFLYNFDGTYQDDLSLLQTVSANLTSAFAATLTARATDSPTIALSSAFTVSANVRRITNTASSAANLTSAFTVSVFIDKVGSIVYASLTSKATVTAAANTNRARPYLIPTGGTNAGVYIDNTIYKIGTGSLHTPGSNSQLDTASVQLSKQVRYTPYIIIGDNEDFYINAWMRISPSGTGITSGTNVVFIDGNAWSFGYYYSGGSFFASATVNGVRLLANNGVAGNKAAPQANVFGQWELSRTNGVVSFNYNNVTYGAATVTTSSVTAVTTSVDSRSIKVGQLNSFNAVQAWFDDIFIAQGTSTRTVNNRATTAKLYLPYDSNYLDYYTGIDQNASAALSSAATLTASITRPALQLNGTLFSAAALTATISKTTGTSSALTSAFSQTAVAKKAVFTGSQMVAEASVTPSPNRVRFADILATSTASLSTNAVKIARVNSTEAAIFTLSAETGNIRHGFAAMQANTSLTTNISVLRAIKVDWTSTASLAIDAISGKLASASLNSQASLTANNTRTRKTSVALATSASELAAVVRIGRGLIHMDSTSALSITAKVKTGNVVAMDATALVVAEAKRTRTTPVDLQTAVTLFADGTTNILCNGDLVSTTSMTVTVNKIANGINLDVGSFSINASARVLGTITADLYVDAFELTLGSRTTIAASALTATSSMQIEISRVKYASADLTAWFSEMAIGEIINIDPALTYMIPPDVREWTIPAETREWMIEWDERTYTL